VPGLGTARQRKREQIEGGQGCFASLSLPGDISRGAAGTARLDKARLVGYGDFVGDGLRKDLLGNFNVGWGDLETNASDEVGDLPVETDEIFIFEEAEDASRLDDCASDDGLGKIAVAADRDEFAVLR
jgi:hypothetical protein